MQRYTVMTVVRELNELQRERFGGVPMFYDELENIEHDFDKVINRLKLLLKEWTPIRLDKETEKGFGKVVCILRDMELSQEQIRIILKYF